MKNKQKTISLILAMVLVLSIALPLGELMTPKAKAAHAYEPVEFVTHNGITFGRMTSAYGTQYVGSPMFDGVENHLDDFIDLLLTEMDDDDVLALVASGRTTPSYPQGHYENGGSRIDYRIITGLGSAGGDVGNPGETQWPNQMALAQSWDKELVYTAGAQYANEARTRSGAQSVNTIAGSLNRASSTSGLVDIRSNPLAGRYDEGYGEDSYMVGMFVDLWGKGFALQTPYDATTVGGRLGPYSYVQISTKHYHMYNSEFFRVSGNYNTDVRSWFEYMGPSAARAFNNGTITGYMSSYGMTNGIPSTSSFIHAFARANSYEVDGIRFNFRTGFDLGGSYIYNPIQGIASFALRSPNGNGDDFDQYYSSTLVDQNAMLIMAGHSPAGNANGYGSGELAADNAYNTVKEALQYGVLGITWDHIYEMAKGPLAASVRCGAYDERDASGTPLYWGALFYDYTSDGTQKSTHATDANKEVAMRAAEESMVLLKNSNGALPLSIAEEGTIYGSMQEVYEYGGYSSQINHNNPATRATYTHSVYGWEAALNAREAIINKAATVTSLSGRALVTIQNSDGKYLTTDVAGNLTFESAPIDDGTQSSYFEFEEWGEGASSFYSRLNSKWVQTGTDVETGVRISGGMETATVISTDVTCTFEARFKYNGISRTAVFNEYPEYFELIDLGGGEFAIKAGNKYNMFNYGFNSAVPNLSGWYLTTSSDGSTIEIDYDLISNPPIYMTGPGWLSSVSNAKDIEAAGYPSGNRFKITTINPAGADAGASAVTDDYAIVVIGHPHEGISGEGADRMSLAMGQSQVDMAQNIAAAYKAEGKKTIVVIKANYPVIVEALKNDPNIDAILFWPLGGQYEGEALARVLFGDANPTGRLVSTWYKGDEFLPQFDKYSMLADLMTLRDGYKSVPLNMHPNVDVSPDDIILTVDTTNSDLQQYKFTYMYADPANVTYPFGYGLSYSSFSFGTPIIPASVNSVGTFNVSVPVTNNGSVATSEVVQVYITKNGSAYGDYAVNKKLVGFEKVSIAPSSTSTVTIRIDPKDFAIWDVNAKELIVENGAYTIYIADSSDLNQRATLRSATIFVAGDTVSELYREIESNVWTHSFASSNVTYREYSKAVTAEATKNYLVDGKVTVNTDTFSVLSKGAGAWSAIPGVDLNGVSQVRLQVASTEASNTIELRAGSPTGVLLGTGTFGATGFTEYYRYADDDTYYSTGPSRAHGVSPGGGTLYGPYTDKDMMVNELAYETLTIPVSGGSGVQSLYIVFKNADIRVATIAFTMANQPSPGGGMNQPSPGGGMNQPSPGGGMTTTPPKVSIKAPVNGTVTISNANPATGDEVTVTVKPESGYKLDDLIITDKDGNRVPYTDNGDGTYSFTYEGSDVTIEALFVPLGAAPTVEPFDDVKSSDWFHEYVMYVYDHGLMDGTGPRIFSPNMTTSRAMVVTVLWRMVGSPAASGTNPFTDLKADWYRTAVQWAVNNGITNGVTDTLFAPDEPVTREQLAAFLYRFAEYMKYDVSQKSSLTGYTDASRISPYARDAMAWANAMEIITGETATTLNPRSASTRAVLATVLTRFCEMYEGFD